LHLGCGNFHRAHQVAATQVAIEIAGQAGLGWGITSVAMRKPDLSHRLAGQDNLYTLLTRQPGGTVASVMGAIHETIFAGNPTIDLTGRLADPAIRIVTITVTASGYYLGADGRLDTDAKDITADLSRARPQTIVGVLYAGLSKICRNNTVPPVILSCDNVHANGTTLRRAVVDFAHLKGDSDNAAWIANDVQFPNTMVDRIVPAPGPNDLADARQFLGGLEDYAPVSAESWFQWVIEPFNGPRPLWEAHPGTRFVPNIAVYERAKLQMLNGTHMILAYVGALAEFSTIAEAACDPFLGSIAAKFMREEQSAGGDLSRDEIDRYASDLMARFRNPGIIHEVERIGRNGSVKMATRIIKPMRRNLMTAKPCPGAILLIASWIRWFGLHEQDALEIALIDPRVDTLRRICADARDDYSAQAEAFMTMEAVFGPPLPDYERQIAHIATMLARLASEPVRDVLRSLTNLHA